MSDYDSHINGELYRMAESYTMLLSLTTIPVMAVQQQQQQHNTDTNSGLDQGVKYRTQVWKRTTSNPSGLMPNQIITSRC